MDSIALKSHIKELSKKYGFAACGIARAVLLKNEFEKFEKAIQQGFHADMDYLSRDPRRRFNPGEVLEGAESVIVFLASYNHGYRQSKGAFYKISKYALTDDYHDVVLMRLKAISKELQTLFPDHRFKVYTDTGPVAEKAWGVSAGLGVFGKNTLLLTPEGSFFFIGVIISSLRLPPDTVQLNDLCEECDLCLRACPTGALVEPFRLDARKCLSYHTIENKGEIPEYISRKLGTRLYGCDTCQDVCPYNRKATPVSTFFQASPAVELSKEDFENMDEDTFKKLFKGTPIKRLKFKRYQRTLEAIRKNLRPPGTSDGLIGQCKSKL